MKIWIISGILLLTGCTYMVSKSHDGRPFNDVKKNIKPSQQTTEIPRQADIPFNRPEAVFEQYDMIFEMPNQEGSSEGVEKSWWERLFG